jgi:Txe/YoeB family toxin of Txe-Axe toxin-antitoxin module
MTRATPRSSLYFYLYNMAKAAKKKTAKKASKLFHNIMKASFTVTPKPAPKKKEKE